MENSENDNKQGGTTPPITVEFIGKSLSTITNTLKELTDLKRQQTSQVINLLLFLK